VCVREREEERQSGRPASSIHLCIKKRRRSLRCLRDFVSHDSLMNFGVYGISQHTARDNYATRHDTTISSIPSCQQTNLDSIISIKSNTYSNQNHQLKIILCVNFLLYQNRTSGHDRNDLKLLLCDFTQSRQQEKNKNDVNNIGQGKEVKNKT